MRTSPRDQDPHGYLKLRNSTAHFEQSEAQLAANARRYLRRRREVFLCALVSVLGVLTARSIPLVEHEREVCACRASLETANVSAYTKRVVVSDVTPLRNHPEPPAHGWMTKGDAAVDLIVTDVGAWVTTERGNVVLAEHCDDARHRNEHARVVHSAFPQWSP